MDTYIVSLIVCNFIKHDYFELGKREKINFTLQVAETLKWLLLAKNAKHYTST